MLKKEKFEEKKPFKGTYIISHGQFGTFNEKISYPFFLQVVNLKKIPEHFVQWSKELLGWHKL